MKYIWLVTCALLAHSCPTHSQVISVGGALTYSNLRGSLSDRDAGVPNTVFQYGSWTKDLSLDNIFASIAIPAALHSTVSYELGFNINHQHSCTQVIDRVPVEMTIAGKDSTIQVDRLKKIMLVYNRIVQSIEWHEYVFKGLSVDVGVNYSILFKTQKIESYFLQLQESERIPSADLVESTLSSSNSFGIVLGVTGVVYRGDGNSWSVYCKYVRDMNPIDDAKNIYSDALRFGVYYNFNKLL